MLGKKFFRKLFSLGVFLIVSSSAPGTALAAGNCCQSGTNCASANVPFDCPAGWVNHPTSHCVSSGFSGTCIAGKQTLPAVSCCNANDCQDFDTLGCKAAALAADVPTMSEWGALSMGILILVAGTIALRRTMDRA